jgi:hypothetical protein
MICGPTHDSRGCLKKSGSNHERQHEHRKLAAIIFTGMVSYGGTSVLDSDF